jgi:hypothetical protein
MNLVRFFETQSVALEAFLPSIADEDARMEALCYLRGIQTVLASVPASDRSNVIDFEDRHLEHRIKAATLSCRQRQIAAANRQLAAADRYVRHIRGEDFGWEMRNDID